MTNFEVREKFLNFFQKNHHKILPSSSLIPKNDPSLLFVNAGMNQFKNVFLGLETPAHQNVITIQKCLRAGGKHNDLETVGETSFHHTFFEMMGNFSFGQYFKKEAIAFSWNFLTEELNLDPKSLWVSVYEEDEEAYEIWNNEQSIPENKIYRMGKKDNFWQMGDTGPCGPCSEIHYYQGEEKRPDPKKFMEIWNLVFTEYDLRKEGRFKLPTPCVDTGMGLERLCSVLQNKRSNYHTDLFLAILLELEKACAYKYDFEEKNQTDQQKAFRVLADHSRAISFLISDGVIPGNEGANYVLRRILRRALYYSQKLESKNNLLQIGISKTISFMAEVYPELKQEENLIQSLVEREAKQFFDNLKKGRKRLEDKLKTLSQKFIDVKTAWELYGTYGFPTDLTRLIAKEKGWGMITEEDLEKYKINLSKESKESSVEKNQKEKSEDLTKILLQNLDGQQQTIFTGYKKNKEIGKILLIHPYGNTDFSKGKITLQTEDTAWLLLDKTCFYPEGGGPIGDIGGLTTETGSAQVLDCKKQGLFIVHKIKVLNGEIKKDQKCEMNVNKKYRKGIASSHTATHLLNSSLRSVLGDSIRQAGSLVEPFRLRFDFTHSKALTQKENKKVEEQLWESIEKSEKLSSSYKDFDQAVKEGFLFLQGENYEESVRVICIGNQSSKELCGGIHVQNTKEIENFKIVSEKGVQSGVRRIKAYTGLLFKLWESFLVKQNKELREYLEFSLPSEKKTDPFFILKENYFWEGLIEKQNPFLKWIENKDQELKKVCNRIVHLEDKKINVSVLEDQDLIKIKSHLHPLAQQNLELRECLKLPLPKEKNIRDSFLKQNEKDQNSSLKEEMPFECFFEESGNPLIDWVKDKEQEVKESYKQWDKIKELELTAEALLKTAKKFQFKDQKGQLLIAIFPLQDRKILSHISDFLLSKLSSGVLVLLGEGSGDKHPIFVNLTKDFEKKLSAGEILKHSIVPLCKGQGGGKSSFAQGSISDRLAFSKLEKKLLDEWSQ